MSYSSKIFGIIGLLALGSTFISCNNTAFNSKSFSVVGKKAEAVQNANSKAVSATVTPAATSTPHGECVSNLDWEVQLPIDKPATLPQMANMCIAEGRRMASREEIDCSRSEHPEKFAEDVNYISSSVSETDKYIWSFYGGAGVWGSCKQELTETPEASRGWCHCANSGICNDISKWTEWTKNNAPEIGTGAGDNPNFKDIRLYCVKEKEDQKYERKEEPLAKPSEKPVECKLGESKSENKCIANICKEEVPGDAEICVGDDKGLAGNNISNTIVSSCTKETQCEYTCLSGFHLDAPLKKCVADACASEAINYPDCSICADGKYLEKGKCIKIPNDKCSIMLTEVKSATKELAGAAKGTTIYAKISLSNAKNATYQCTGMVSASDLSTTMATISGLVMDTQDYSCKISYQDMSGKSESCTSNTVKKYACRPGTTNDCAVVANMISNKQTCKADGSGYDTCVLTCNADSTANGTKCDPKSNTLIGKMPSGEYAYFNLNHDETKKLIPSGTASVGDVLGINYMVYATDRIDLGITRIYRNGVEIRATEGDYTYIISASDQNTTLTISYEYHVIGGKLVSIPGGSAVLVK